MCANWDPRKFLQDSQPDGSTNREADERFLLNDLTAAQVYCRAFIKRHARTFYLSSLLLPTAKRDAIWSIYAFCRYTDDLVDNPLHREHPAGLLDDWEEQLVNHSPRHPVALVYQHVADSYSIPLKIPQELIAGVRMDLERSRYETWDDLRLYCYRVASVVGLLLLPVLGYEGGEQTVDYAIELGIAMQLTNILRDVGEDARMGRIYLPQEDIARFGYDEERLRAGVIDENFTALLDFEIARARTYYRSAQRGIAMLDKSARPAILASALLYSRILNSIESNGYNVFSRRAFVNKPRKAYLIGKVPFLLNRLDRWRLAGGSLECL